MTITLSKGNSKLGKIISFSIPSKVTCPGKTAWCDSHCYASKLERIYPAVYNSYQNNLKEASKRNFSDNMILALSKVRSNTRVRLHVSGDFYSVKYINDWIKIITARPDLRFYAYTKSWRIKHLIPSLKRLNKLPNLTLLASTDISIGANTGPDYLREAFSGDTLPTSKTKLVACPAQQDATVVCASCKLCPNKKLSCGVFFKTH